MLFSLFLGAAVATAAPTVVERGSSSPVPVTQDVPDSAGAAVLHPFVSFSIEFAFFPDFAGMLMHMVCGHIRLIQLHRQPVQP